jgi:hypothetical protein
VCVLSYSLDGSKDESSSLTGRKDGEVFKEKGEDPGKGDSQRLVS